MIRSVCGSIFVIELALTLFPPPIPPVTPDCTGAGCDDTGLLGGEIEAVEDVQRLRVDLKSVGRRDPNGAFADGDRGRPPVDVVLQDDFRGFAVTGSDRLEPVVSVAVGADPGSAVAEGDRCSAVVQLENGGDFVVCRGRRGRRGHLLGGDRGLRRLPRGSRRRAPRSRPSGAGVRSYGHETGRPCPRRCRRYLLGAE